MTDTTDSSQRATEPATAEPVERQEKKRSRFFGRHPFGLHRGDQLFLGVLLTVALALMAVHWARLSGWGLQPVEIERMQPRENTYRVDINRATWVEWMHLEGIGETLARRIVADREENGPFDSIDELQRVNGIGPKTVEKLRPRVTIGKDRAAGSHAR